LTNEFSIKIKKLNDMGEKVHSVKKLEVKRV